MSKRAFRPGLYSQVSSETNSELLSETITKGKGKKELIVNIDVLNEILSDLRHHAHEKQNSLTGSLAKKFNKYKEMVSLLHETNTYPLIVDMVKGHFSDIEEIIPGTIGAYCYGGFFETNFDDDKFCSAIAAGSMPSVRGDVQACRYPAVIAEYNRTGYTLIPLRHYEKEKVDSEESSEYRTDKTDKTETNNQSSNYKTDKSDNKSSNKSIKRKGFVFVPHKSLDEFMGFSLSEKKKLKELGIDHVNLYGYSKDGKDHYKLASIDLDEMTCRKRHAKRRNHHGSGDSSFNLEEGGLIGVLVILIIVLLIGGFLLSNKWRYGRL